MQNDEPQKRNLLTIGGAAEYLGISIDTLRRWEKKGRIEPFRSPGGHRYFDKKALDDLFGKRYTRDEPTIRRTFDKSESPKTDDDNAIQTTKEVSLQDITIKENPATVIKLPHWRAIKESEDFEKTIDNAIPEPHILDRPVREVKIPESTRIRITKSESILTSSEAYFEQQSMSILTPQINEIKQTIGEVSEPISKLLPQIQNPKISVEDKKTVIYLVIFSIAIIFSVIWFLLWKNSQVILSPVP